MAFADGDILSASQLNSLVARVNALEDQRIGVNLGFAEVELTSTNRDAYWQMVHRFDWLHLRWHEDNDDTTLRIYVNGTEIADSGGAGGDLTANLDISGLALTPGALYTVRARWGEQDSNGLNLQIKYLVEAEDEL